MSVRARKLTFLALLASADFREQRKELLDTHGAATLQEAVETIQTELTERRECVPLPACSIHPPVPVG